MIEWIDGDLTDLTFGLEILRQSAQRHHKPNSWEDFKFVGEPSRENYVIASARIERVL